MRVAYLALLLGVASVGRARNFAPARPPANVVEVIGFDYGFQAPSELPAGLTTFHFQNKGKSRHELSILRLKQGATIDQFVELRKASKSSKPVLDGAVGVLFANPAIRSTSGLTTNLVPGRYALICGLTDSAGAPAHFTMGMYTVITVRQSKTSSAPETIKGDTIVATEYAFRYPRTLSPGHHTLVFRNEGTVNHELNIALLKRGVTLDQFMQARRANKGARALVDEGLGVLFTVDREEPLGHLEVNLLPGREYRMICIFTNDAKSPPHFELGMYGSIKIPQT